MTLHHFLGRRPPDLAAVCAGEADCTGSGWKLTAEGMASVCGCEFGRLRRIAHLQKASGVPADAFRWEPLTVDCEEIGAIVASLEEWSKGFKRGGYGSLLLVGDTGRGKTRLSRCLAAYLAEERFRVQWVDFPSFLRRIKSSYDGSGETEDQIIAEVLDNDLTVIDDIGAESHAERSDWADQRLYEILNSAINRGRPSLVITTNLTGRQIRERYGQRVLSRLLECCGELMGGRIVSFDGIADKRRPKRVDAAGKDWPRRNQKERQGAQSGRQSRTDVDHNGSGQALELFAEDGPAGDSLGQDPVDQVGCEGHAHS